MFHAPVFPWDMISAFLCKHKCCFRKTRACLFNNSVMEGNSIKEMSLFIDLQQNTSYRPFCLPTKTRFCAGWGVLCSSSPYFVVTGGRRFYEDNFPLTFAVQVSKMFCQEDYAFTMLNSHVVVSHLQLCYAQNTGS